MFCLLENKEIILIICEFSTIAEICFIGSSIEEIRQVFFCLTLYNIDYSIGSLVYS